MKFRKVYKNIVRLFLLCMFLTCLAGLCAFSKEDDLAPSSEIQRQAILTNIARNILPVLSTDHASMAGRWAQYSDILDALDELKSSLDQLGEVQGLNLFTMKDAQGNLFFKRVDTDRSHTTTLLRQLTMQESYRLLKIMFHLAIEDMDRAMIEKSPVRDLMVRDALTIHLSREMTIAQLRNFIGGQQAFAFEGFTGNQFYPRIPTFAAEAEVVNVEDGIQIQCHRPQHVKMLDISGKRPMTVTFQENFPYSKRKLGSLNIDGQIYDVVISQKEYSRGGTEYLIEIYKQNEWQRRDYQGLVAFLQFDFLPASRVGQNYIKIHTGPFMMSSWTRFFNAPDFISNRYLNHALSVDPDLRGSGVGTLLSVLAFAYARDVLRSDRVTITEVSLEGERLYQRLGLGKIGIDYMAKMFADDSSGSSIALDQPPPSSYLLGRQNETYQANLDDLLRRNFGRLQWKFSEITDSWLLEFMRQASFTPFRAEFIGSTYPDEFIIEEGSSVPVPFYFTVRWTQKLNDFSIRGQPMVYVLDESDNVIGEVPLSVVDDYQDGAYRFRADMPPSVFTHNQVKLRIAVQDQKGIQVVDQSFNIQRRFAETAPHHSLPIAA